MERLMRTLGCYCDGLAIAGGWALMVLAGVVAVEVIARKLFNSSLQGVDEVGGYVLAVTAGAGFAHALLGQAHIRVDILLNRLGLRARAILNVLAYAVMAVFAAFLLWRATTVWLRSYELESVAPTPLATPLILPQGLWVAALLLFTLAAIAVLCRASVKLSHGQWHIVAQELGTVDPEREAEIEAVAAENRLALTEARKRAAP